MTAQTSSRAGGLTPSLPLTLAHPLAVLQAWRKLGGFQLLTPLSPGSLGPPPSTLHARCPQVSLALGILRQHQVMGAMGPGPEQTCPWPDQHLGPGPGSHPVLAVLESRVGCPAELQQLWVRLAPLWGPLAGHRCEWDGLARLYLAEGLIVTR